MKILKSTIPSELKQFLYLNLIGLCLGLSDFLLQHFELSVPSTSSFFNMSFHDYIINSFVCLVIIYFIFLKINWLRIIYGILTVFGLFISIYLIYKELKTEDFVGAVSSILQEAAFFISLFYLFSKGVNDWYEKKEETLADE